MSDLTSALTNVLLQSAPKVRSLVDGALADAKEIGGDAGKQAGIAAAFLAVTLEDAAARRIDPDVAKEAITRSLSALDMVKDGAIEAGQRKAAERAKQAIEIASDVGFALLKAGIAAGVAAL